LAGLGLLIGEVLGVKAAPIEYRFEGKRRSLRVGDIAQAEIEGLPGRDGGDAGIAAPPFTLVPGFPAVVNDRRFWSDGSRDLAPSPCLVRAYYWPWESQTACDRVRNASASFFLACYGECNTAKKGVP
jgi:hypothetical protein